MLLAPAATYKSMCSLHIRRTSPPLTAVDTALAPVRRRVWIAWRQFGYVWDDFNGEEAKRRWKWSRQREQEAKFWKSFVQFLASECHLSDILHRPHHYDDLMTICVGALHFHEVLLQLCCALGLS